MAFAQLLDSALRARGVSGRQLALAANCAAGAVSNARTGNDAPNDDMARKWAQILDIPKDGIDEWLTAAAAQRANRQGVDGRKGEARLAQRVAELEAQVARSAQFDRVMLFMREERQRIVDGLASWGIDRDLLMAALPHVDEAYVDGVLRGEIDITPDDIERIRKAAQITDEELPTVRALLAELLTFARHFARHVGFYGAPEAGSIQPAGPTPGGASPAAPAPSPPGRQP